MNTVAPIVLFVYNRLEHTKQTIEALAANILASESELFIYSDAPKNDTAVSSVHAVRSFIKMIQGFKSVTIIERDTNWGLAKSIIDGVTEIVNQYGKVIVLEDDIVTSPYFLKFMNGALDFYENEKKVWHISGWNYPIYSDGLEDAFFWYTMNCWGWATWQDRWKHFEKNVNKLLAEFKKSDIYQFNINNSEDMWEQVIANKRGKIDTWAIFWYAAIFQKKGLCLNPVISFVRNIGLDGTGIHCGTNSSLVTNIISEREINFNAIVIEENEIAIKRIMQFYKKQKKWINRICRLIKKIIYGITKNDKI